MHPEKDEPAWVFAKSLKDSDENVGKKQEIDSKDRVKHIWINDLGFLKGKMNWSSDVDGEWKTSARGAEVAELRSTYTDRQAKQ